MSTILQEQPAQYGASGDDELPRREADALSRMDWEAYENCMDRLLESAVAGCVSDAHGIPMPEAFERLQKGIRERRAAGQA